jgi:uncharacterized membrane protein YfhO
VIADDLAQLDRLARPDFDPAATVILGTTAPQVAAASAPEVAPTVIYAPNQVQVRASVSAPAILVLSDAYSEDWRASVDGADASLYRVNYALRGVWLPPGEHTVVFSYRPRAFLVGGGVSLSVALVLLAYGCWGWWRRSAEAATEGPPYSG